MKQIVHLHLYQHFLHQLLVIFLVFLGHSCLFFLHILHPEDELIHSSALNRVFYQFCWVKYLFIFFFIYVYSYINMCVYSCITLVTSPFAWMSTETITVSACSFSHVHSCSPKISPFSPFHALFLRMDGSSTWLIPTAWSWYDRIFQLSLLNSNLM